MSKKVMVEVEEGSTVWACSQHDQKRPVEMLVGSTWRKRNPYYEGFGQWRLCKEPPKPVTVQPGTFPWAVAMLLGGKKVRRAAWGAGQHFVNAQALYVGVHPDQVKATDWEVYGD